MKGVCQGRKNWIQRFAYFNKTPIVGVHWAAECAFLSQGWIVTSTVMNKNRPDSLKQQETISIIFNWDISTMLRRGRPILLITRMTTDPIGLHPVLLPLVISMISIDFR